MAVWTLGLDFAYSDRKGHWVAVELKFSTSSNENLVRQGLAQMQHFVEAHSIRFDRAELWLLDKSNLLLSVWSTTKEEPIGSYGLANVVSTTAGASSERRRPVPLDSNEVEQRVAEWRQHILVLFKDMTGGHPERICNRSNPDRPNGRRIDAAICRAGCPSAGIKGPQRSKYRCYDRARWPLGYRR